MAMQYQGQTQEKPGLKAAHNIIMENRKALTISGVNDIDSFDEHTIIIFTELGELIIKGRDLHITSMSVETGELIMDGEVSSLTYGEGDRRTPNNFLARLFK